MAAWRDIRAERVVNARFVYGPKAGVDKTVATSPNGSPPPLIRLDDTLEPHAEGAIAYELVDLGASSTARYRLRP